MSLQYDTYLTNHIDNVYKGYEWINKNIPELTAFPHNLGWQCLYGHDQSKYDHEEYEAYDAYFYGDLKDEEGLKNFRYAWLHHIHNNPHHWQYWVLINDDPNEGEIAMDMPLNYIIEMICDWWAFSWAKGNLYEIFAWYDQHKAYMKLSENTRKTVEDILNQIHAKLDESEEVTNG